MNGYGLRATHMSNALWQPQRKLVRLLNLMPAKVTRTGSGTHTRLHW